MLKKYTSEQFWKLYEELPQELRDALFAEETGEYIYEICEKYEITDNLDEIVDCVGQVLVGVLPPADFQKTLEKELGIEKETAQKVGREIHRFVFYPVKTTLEELYKIEITGVPTPAKPLVVKPSAPDRYKESLEETGEEEILKEKREALRSEVEELAAAGEKKEEEKKDDTYREPLE